MKTSYLAVPKVACTSLKSMFFEVENGRSFEPYVANGRKVHIHNVYPSLNFSDVPKPRIADHARFALVRDPVKRFLSCYSNRVLHLKELSQANAGAALAGRDLAPDPDLGMFIDRLDDYRAASVSIRHHTNPLVTFLGRDPGYFAGLYRIEQIDTLIRALSDRLGRDLVAGRLQTGGPKLDVGLLTAAQLAQLRARYAEDYRVYGDWL
jgi:hypothetical protein